MASSMNEELRKYQRQDSTKKDEVIDRLLENKLIREFILKNDLSSEQVSRSINVLMDIDEDTNINEDGSISSKKYPEYTIVLDFKNDKVVRKYKLKEEYRKNKNIQSIGMESELLEASVNDFSVDTAERRSAANYARQFVNSYKTKNPIKGLYICGPFRSGKTYLASAIAHEVAALNYSVIDVYYPELSSYVKSLIDSEEFTAYSIVEKLKYCDLLILDDFLGENLSPWMRDEILGPVLQYRMVKKKGTIFTSNVSMQTLVTRLRKDGSEMETTKAQRIAERVKEISTQFLLTEKYSDNK